MFLGQLLYYTNLLGLTGNFTVMRHGIPIVLQAEGLGMTSAVKNHKKQFKEITSESLNLHKLDPISLNSSTKKLLQKILTMNHGDVISVATGWESHAISISFVKEKDKLYILVNNKGQSPFERILNASDDDNFHDNPFQVYTLSNISSGENTKVLTELLNTCKGGRTNIIKAIIGLLISKPFILNRFANLFNSTQMKKLRDLTLSKNIIKSHQKVGNCAVANINVTWHLHLAGQEIKNNPNLTLEEAIGQTKEDYKAQRYKGRLQAIQFLLQNRKSIRYGWEELVLQSLGKFILKTKKGHKHTIYHLLKDLRNSDPESFEELRGLLEKMTTNKNISYIDRYNNIVFKAQKQNAVIKILEAKKTNNPVQIIVKKIKIYYHQKRCKKYCKKAWHYHTYNHTKHETIINAFRYSKSLMTLASDPKKLDAILTQIDKYETKEKGQGLFPVKSFFGFASTKTNDMKTEDKFSANTEHQRLLINL